MSLRANVTTIINNCVIALTRKVFNFTYSLNKLIIMKKSKLFLLAICCSMAFVPMQIEAQTASAIDNSGITAASSEKQEAATANVLLSRLYEINSMDKSDLTTSDKKELRKEVRSIKSTLKEAGGGIYLSIGAIILILLLLIIILR